MLRSYDHLTRLLTKILDERPSNAVDLFEDFSRKVKEERFASKADNLYDRPEKSAEGQLADTQLNLFTVTGSSDWCSCVGYSLSPFWRPFFR